MSKRVSSILGVTAVCTVLAAALLPVGAQAAVRHFDATVLSKDSSSKTVRLSIEGGATLTVFHGPIAAAAKVHALRVAKVFYGRLQMHPVADEVGGT
jgi:hypothetical protein